MTTEDRFAAIRPYHDAEVRGVLDRLIANPEVVAAVAGLRFPRANRRLAPLLHGLIRWMLRRQFRHVRGVRDFQMVLERYMRAMIESSTGDFTVSGLDHIDPERPCLFIGNHRDIALDPAFVNYALYEHGRDTVRIAIGDNLLTRDYASDLMRLNKSFIVRRSLKGPRQMLAAAQELSAYIAYSLLEERHSIWIAQREGRAKDGWDRTEPAVIKMLGIGKPKERGFAEHIALLNLVPVSISYEWDPCDTRKAHELCERATRGRYEKAAQEDIDSIAHSVTAPKGHVHVAFGESLGGGFAGPDEVAHEIDRQVLALYRIQPTNLVAYRMAEGRLPADFEDQGAAADGVEPAFRARLATLPEAERPYLIEMYANPLRNRDAIVDAA